MTAVDLAPVWAEPAAGPGPDAPRRRGQSALRRLGRSLSSFVPVVFVSTFVTYSLGALSNADPAATILGQDGATPAAIHRLNHALGLDRPLVVQYWHWLSNALHGDLGRSYFTQIPVWHSISQRLPVDVSIAFPAAALGALIGGGAGVLAATKRGGWIDRTITVVCSAVSTLPAFVVGIVLVVIFAMKVRVLPGNGYVGPTTNVGLWAKHIILPSLALSLPLAADVARQLRTSLVDVLDQNYIIGASVRGLPRRRVLLRHALRNAAGPALTVLGVDIPLLISGAVAAEAVFSLPGLGQLAITSASTRDIPVVQGVLLVTSAFVIVFNLGVNAALGWLRPAEGR